MGFMRYQPQGRTRVRSEWERQGLANATLFQATDIDVMGRSDLVRVGAGHALSATPLGLGVSQSGGANVWQASALGRVIGTGPHFAVMLTFRLNSMGQTQKYLAVDGTSTRQAAIIYGYVANTVEFFSSGHSGADPRTGSQIVINDLLPHTVIYTYDGVTLRGFLDGVEKISVAKTFTLLVGSTTTGHIGGATASSNLSNVTFLAHARFNQGLSRDAARVLSSNPWQLFADPEEDDVYTASAPGGTSLTVAPAALQLGGGNVALRVTRRVDVQPAALTVTGATAGLRAARRLAAQAATLQLAGEAVAMRTARRIPVEQSDLLLVGGAATLRTSRRLAVGAVPLTIAPGDAALKAARRVAVSAATLVLDAGPAQLRATRRLTVAPVEMAITGQTIGFTYAPAPEAGSYVMAVTPAALSLSGGVVGMRVIRRFPVATANFVMSGGDVRLLAAHRTGIAPAALGLATGQILLRADRRLQVEPAQLVVAGGTVTFRHSSQIEYARAPAGSGYAPQRVEVQARPAQLGGYRPASLQRNNR